MSTRNRDNRNGCTLTSIMLFLASVVVAYLPIFVDVISNQAALEQDPEISSFETVIQKTIDCDDFRYISVSLMLVLLIERMLLSNKIYSIPIKMFNYLEMFWSLAVFVVWFMFKDSKIHTFVQNCGLNIGIFDCFCLGISLLLGIFIIIIKCKSSVD